MSRYLLALALSIAAVLLLLAGVNAFINPYGHFDVPKIAGINQFALGFNHRLPLAKALAVDRLRPATIIVGNSRAETGYDPAHRLFSERPAYNLAIGGANMQTARRYILEALASGQLRHIVLAVDFTMFDPAVWKQGAEESGLLTDAAGNAGGGWQTAKRLATVLLSGTALADSWWSLTHQRRPVAKYLPSGLRDASADIDQVMREGGHRRASLLAESAFLAAALRDLESSRAREHYRRALLELKDVVDTARRRGVRLTLILNPIHARQSYLFATAGLWPAYEQWKRDMVAASGQAGGVEVWDFSAVGSCTAEPLPAKDDRTVRMRWYRETSHFLSAMGDKVLDRIGGRGDADCPEFGQRLLAETLTATLAAQHRSMAKWMDGHPGDVAEIDALARLYGRRP